ncbi:hypothetical protein BJY04DRAFT_219684 [Aspergillus karnatakaensis]|uniref:oxidase ustYa family protein n=1 Tax=Aspergillus karnatakaensis TaxID=1810916 RepID=UPI003CCDA3B7
MRRMLESPKIVDDERLLDDTSSDTWSYPEQKPRGRCGSWWTATFVIFTGVLCLLIGGFLGYNYQGSDLDEVCSRHVSHYSPVLSHVPIRYHRQRFNGSLLKENVFRQDAGPEFFHELCPLSVHSLLQYRPIRVPPEEASRSGITPDQVQISDAYGGGYPANVEGLHHLHCLNLLRQSLYYNYNYYYTQATGAFKNNDFILRKHVSHCLDILRQQLMCTIDVGVLGQVWIHPDNPSPFVDFNTEHQCRNFEDIRQWAERNQLPVETPGDFLRPPLEGQRVLSEVP